MSLWHVSNGMVTPDGHPFWVYVIAWDEEHAKDFAREIFLKHAIRFGYDVTRWTENLIVTRASPVIPVRV